MFIPADILLNVFKVAVILVFVVSMGMMALATFLVSHCEKKEVSANEADAEGGAFESTR